jgi:gamma-glutamylcyclotransferase (GGCT)/AIG2-like uncharacterized protein YtfP
MNPKDHTASSEKDRVFVYGTLRKGSCHHQVLQKLHTRFIAYGSVKGQLYDLGEYPGARKGGSAGDRVQGEVYLLPASGRALKVLDKFEGYNRTNPQGSLFRREKAVVNLVNGDDLHAWIYWLHHTCDTKRRVRSGKYRQVWV